MVFSANLDKDRQRSGETSVPAVWKMTEDEALQQHRCSPWYSNSCCVSTVELLVHAASSATTISCFKSKTRLNPYFCQTELESEKIPFCANILAYVHTSSYEKNNLQTTHKNFRKHLHLFSRVQEVLSKKRYRQCKWEKKGNVGITYWKATNRCRRVD